MEKFKTLGNVSLVLLAVIGALVSLAYLYVHFFIKDYTVGINYVSDQVGLDIVYSEDLTEEEKSQYDDRWFLEANFYSNSKENGIALQEMNLNYFTNYTLTSDTYRSTGMQNIGNLKPDDLVLYRTTENEVATEERPGFYYYDTSDGISYSSNLRTKLTRDEKFIIKIDDRPFEIQLTGAKHWDTYETSWYGGTTVVHNHLYYTYVNVFVDVMEAIRSNSSGYGDYYVTLDLSKYFSIYEYDTNTGKFKVDDVTDIIKNYAVLKFHYDENGAVNANQSLFGQIECNKSYGLKDSIDTTYWQERMVYTLNESNFDYRYSDTFNGYFISLKIDTKNIFKNMPRAKVNINIDLQSEYLINNNINILGFDYNALENFEIDTLTITGNNQIIYLLDYSLHNTNLQTLRHSSGITFDFSDTAINSEYLEVVL